jgi:cytochrome P450
MFDPLSPELIGNPYPFYDRLRADDPVHSSPLGFYVLSRHADVSTTLRDKRFGKDFVGPSYATSRRPNTGRAGLPLDAPLDADAESARSHPAAWLGGAGFHGAPDRRHAAAHSADRRCHARPDRAAAPRGPDRRFRLSLPVTVICEMLGIPPDHHEMFLTDARDSGRLLDPVQLSRAELDEANARDLAAAAYFQQLFELRRREPGDDLTTRLVQAEEQGGKLTNDELTANIILLFRAGHETTVNLIGNGLLALHRDPDQLELLRENPSLTPNAIEELLRYDSSVQGTGRTALEDVEVGGTAIRKGEPVLCLLGAANRDPAVYLEPDRLDITRANIRPLSFGGGIHFCLGAQLARIEGEIAIATLLRRFPKLRIDDVDHPDWRQTFVLRGLNQLPASW